MSRLLDSKLRNYKKLSSYQEFA